MMKSRERIADECGYDPEFDKSVVAVVQKIKELRGGGINDVEFAEIARTIDKQGLTQNAADALAKYLVDDDIITDAELQAYIEELYTCITKQPPSMVADAAPFSLSELPLAA